MVPRLQWPFQCLLTSVPPPIIALYIQPIRFVDISKISENNRTLELVDEEGLQLTPPNLLFFSRQRQHCTFTCSILPCSTNLTIHNQRQDLCQSNVCMRLRLSFSVSLFNEHFSGWVKSKPQSLVPHRSYSYQSIKVKLIDNLKGHWNVKTCMLDMFLWIRMSLGIMCIFFEAYQYWKVKHLVKYTTTTWNIPMTRRDIF
jgi:hypothetical protein